MVAGNVTVAAAADMVDIVAAGPSYREGYIVEVVVVEGMLAVAVAADRQILGVAVWKSVLEASNARQSHCWGCRWHCFLEMLNPEIRQLLMPTGHNRYVDHQMRKLGPVQSPSSELMRERRGDFDREVGSQRDQVTAVRMKRDLAIVDDSWSPWL